MKNEPAIQQLPQKSIFPPPKKRENNFLFPPRRSRVKIAPPASPRGTFSPPHTFPPFKRRISPPFPFPSRGKSCVGASPKKPSSSDRPTGSYIMATPTHMYVCSVYCTRKPKRSREIKPPPPNKCTNSPSSDLIYAEGGVEVRGSFEFELCGVRERREMNENENETGACM